MTTKFNAVTGIGDAPTSRRVKGGVITTGDTNLGDDLIRLGLTRMLATAIPGVALDVVVVNKHTPLEAYGLGGLARLPKKLPKGERHLNELLSAAVSRLRESLLATCEIVVYS